MLRLIVESVPFAPDEKELMLEIKISDGVIKICFYGTWNRSLVHGVSRFLSRAYSGHLKNRRKEVASHGNAGVV